ncbi:MerR family transcriptional regulator [Nocardia callitridis]|uniref:MerR family transcriptional regulator n=1 Tax=Nocardia callitridis TaxID=648753 RepID=A0ABP9JXS7_9NOCA
MLTIGQLAAIAHVSVRTVRHYHQIGLLPEPERDASGYRRYSAQAAVDLVRVRTLADAGVPLARIEMLLHAQPTEFAASVTDIDTALRTKIDQLAEHRRRIAELASGEALVLPPELVAMLERVRSLGVSERTVRLERDWAILMRASDPDAVPRWIGDKIAGFDDQDRMRLYRAFDQSVDRDPHDPRVDRLIDDLETWEIEHEGTGSRPERLDPQAITGMVPNPRYPRPPRRAALAATDRPIG